MAEAGKTKNGRQGIDSPRRGSPSWRALKGNLWVEKRDCPYCGHHKALVTVNKTKCAKCKQRL